jgi:hypothetical protein
MTQPALDFTAMPIDTHCLHPQEIVRLSTQNLSVLVRLQQGPVSNRELVGFALKYTSRLSDLRKAGWDIRIIERDHATGRVVYQLFGRKA